MDKRRKNINVWVKEKQDQLENFIHKYLDKLHTLDKKTGSFLNDSDKCYKLETFSRFIILKYQAALHHYETLVTDISKHYAKGGVLDKNSEQLRGVSNILSPDLGRKSIQPGSYAEVTRETKSTKFDFQMSYQITDNKIIFSFEGILFSLRACPSNINMIIFS